MPRHVFLAPLLVIGALVLAAPAVLRLREARAQTGPGGVEATRRESVAREWRLRGVVLAEAARFAVLQHRTSSRQQLLRVGDVLERGVAVVTIAADHVVLDSEGSAITLRLGHGGEHVSGRVQVPRALPPAILNRRGR